MAIWTPIERQAAGTLANNATSADFTIKVGTKDISDGELRGVSVTVNASAAGTHAARVKVYTEAAKTNLIYDTSIDLSAGTSGSDIMSGIPLFATPTYTLTDVTGGGSKTYTVQFFVRAVD